MRLDGFNQLLTHSIKRVQTGQRVLKNSADAFASDFAHLLIGQIVDTLPFQQDFATFDTAR